MRFQGNGLNATPCVVLLQGWRMRRILEKPGQRAHPARVPTTNPPRRLDIDSSASDRPPEYARITRCPHADRMRLRGFLLVGPGAMTYLADQIQLQHNST